MMSNHVRDYYDSFGELSIPDERHRLASLAFMARVLDDGVFENDIFHDQGIAPRLVVCADADGARAQDAHRRFGFE